MPHRAATRATASLAALALVLVTLTALVLAPRAEAATPGGSLADLSCDGRHAFGVSSGFQRTLVQVALDGGGYADQASAQVVDVGLDAAVGGMTWTIPEDYPWYVPWGAGAPVVQAVGEADFSPVDFVVSEGCAAAWAVGEVTLPVTLADEESGEQWEDAYSTSVLLRDDGSGWSLVLDAPSWSTQGTQLNSSLATTADGSVLYAVSRSLPAAGRTVSLIHAGERAFTTLGTIPGSTEPYASQPQIWVDPDGHLVTLQGYGQGGGSQTLTTLHPTSLATLGQRTISAPVVPGTGRQGELMAAAPVCDGAVAQVRLASGGDFAWSVLPDGALDAGPLLYPVSNTDGLRTLSTPVFRDVSCVPPAPVAPVAPMVVQAECAAPGQPTAPTVALPETAGIDYSLDGGLIPGGTVTVTATPEEGYVLAEADGWTVRDDGTATYSVALDDVDCPAVVVPPSPEPTDPPTTPTPTEPPTTPATPEPTEPLTTPTPTTPTTPTPAPTPSTTATPVPSPESGETPGMRPTGADLTIAGAAVLLLAGGGATALATRRRSHLDQPEDPES